LITVAAVSVIQSPCPTKGPPMAKGGGTLAKGGGTLAKGPQGSRGTLAKGGGTVAKGGTSSKAHGQNLRRNPAHW
jgi:hypothetical protein